MTVDDLVSVWLHNKNPKGVVNVWDKNIADFIFSTKDSENYDIDANTVGNKEVRCFYSYYSKENDEDILNINV